MSNTQQGAQSIGTTWAEIMSEEKGRQLLVIKNRDTVQTVYYVFGSNPQDRDALDLAPGDGVVFDAGLVPDGALWMKATAATSNVVVLKG